MLECTDRAAAFSEFWRSTSVLREIVEFGDSDSIDSSAWEGRSSAARLLMLQFSIGLMMMDQFNVRQEAADDSSSAKLGDLLRTLDEAAREMSAIDHLNSAYWNSAMNHLAIRRAIWGRAGSGSYSLPLSTEPTLAHFTHWLNGDVGGLLKLVVDANQNGVSPSTIYNAFVQAGINSNAQIDLARKLLAESPRSLGLSTDQVNLVADLLKAPQGEQIDAHD